MPELPEVETTRAGLAAIITGCTFTAAIVRNPHLRWPVPDNLHSLLVGQTLLGLRRRAKYLLLDIGMNDEAKGSLIIHLGMSGSLRLTTPEQHVEKHDHVNLYLTTTSHISYVLRLRDPRRFGAVLWRAGEAYAHPLLCKLGVEPLETPSQKATFNANYLKAALKNRHAAIKPLLMDNHLVVGIGNIYASEALFRAGIQPIRSANSLSLADCVKLVAAIQETLSAAIAAGGSTLRDFASGDGKPGYFQQQHLVYGRANAPCYRCGSAIRHLRQAQRSSYWCPHCQR